jgi:hypothetical protein
MNATAASRDFADATNDDSIRSAINAAMPAEMEPPRPLRRPMRESSPYPHHALGPIITAAVEATAEVVQAPIEMCAGSALAHAALAVQAHANVVLPTRVSRPLSLFLVEVAVSGDRKSSVDKKLGWALEKRERALAEATAEAKAEYQNAREAYDVARSAAKQKAGKDARRADIVRSLDDVGDPPEPPLETFISFPDPTIEGVHKYLAIGQPSIGLFNDEGGSFVGGYGMSKENSLKSAAGYSHLWDASPVKRLRAGDGASVLHGRRVSLHLMIQPKAAADWLADETLRDQGLFSRILIAAPKSLAGTRVCEEPPASAHEAIYRFGGRLLKIYERPLPFREGKTAELAPRDLPMTPLAERMWRAFANSIEAKLGAGGRLTPVSGLANKIPEHAARIGGVLELFENFEAQELSDDALARGILLAGWYLDEALRLAEVGHVPDDVRLAELALAWLQESWPHVDGVKDGGRLISVPDLYQLGPNQIRHKEAALRALAVLQDHGWVAKVEGAKRVRGIMRRDVFSVREV